MSPDDPRHGKSSGSMAHWRAGEQPCQACRDAKARAVKRARVDRDRGNPRIVKLGETAHEIVVSITPAQLSAATGIAEHKLSRLRTAGPDIHVNRRTRARILAAGGVDFWTPVGVQRRLRALQAIGWSMLALSDDMGDTHETTLRNLVRREHPKFVRREFAARIIAAYGRLADKPRDGRGATRARNLAARSGWAPPSAWDDIDDVNEQPWVATDLDHVDDIVVERLIAGQRIPSTRAEKVEAMRRWMADGRSQRSLCVMHGWQESRYVVRQDGAA